MTPAPEQAQPVARVSVIIVTCADGSQLKRCLNAIADIPAVVVENGSSDSAGLDPLYPHVRFIRLPRNFGLTKALNIGIRAVSSELVLFLSPEVEISKAAIDALADTLDAEPSVGAVCPLLITSSGSIAAQVSELPTASQPDPEFRETTAGGNARCVTGKAIMVRGFFLRALRQIDERYGDYGSSIELCRQVLRANKTILIHPTATAILQEQLDSLSGAQQADREVGIYRYLAKHLGFAAGLIYLIKRVFAALFSFRFGRVISLVSLRKIDGG